jgi:hypothetical protein|nr:MAG TPA: Protein of unknown function (DUF1360) [Caudoviricetes sp.]
MIDFIIFTTLLACFAAFILTLLYKWGVVEWLQIHGNNFFSQMAHCDFCMSWWVCLSLAIGASVLTGNYYLLLAPFFSTIITRNLV